MSPLGPGEWPGRRRPPGLALADSPTTHTTKAGSPLRGRGVGCCLSRCHRLVCSPPIRGAANPSEQGARRPRAGDAGPHGAVRLRGGAAAPPRAQDQLQGQCVAPVSPLPASLSSPEGDSSDSVALRCRRSRGFVRGLGAWPDAREGFGGAGASADRGAAAGAACLTPRRRQRYARACC